MVRQADTEQERVLRLTTKQRQCMRLVVLRKSSKEIARELGISKPTVDQRIASARQILGAQNRDEAAIIYGRHMGVYDRVIYDPAHIPLSTSLTDDCFPEAEQEAGLRLEEAAIPFSGVLEYQPAALPGFRRSLSGDIITANRLLIIVGLTVGILSVVLVGLAVAQSLSGLLTAP